jgi:hypothetical protein
MERYQKVLSGNGESYSIPIDGVGVLTEQVTAAKTLTANDSGKTLVLYAAVGAQITLPAVAAGLKFKFVVGLAFATTSWTVVAASAVIQGTVIVNGASVLGADEDIITFVNSAENPGDWVEIESDGTNWYVTGVGSASGAITLTAS